MEDGEITVPVNVDTVPIQPVAISTGHVRESVRQVTKGQPVVQKVLFLRFT